MAMTDRLSPHQPATCDSVDAMSPENRALVHEFGYSVVRAFHDAGVTNPAKIRRLVHVVWMGAREPGNRPAAAAPQIVRALNSVWPHLRNAEALVGFLHGPVQYTIAPLFPSAVMTAASGGFDHRVEAALRAHAAALSNWRVNGRDDD